MPTTLPVQAGTLPSGLCPDSYQSMLNAFTAVQSVVLPTGTGIVVIASATQPTDTTAVWQRLDALGKPLEIYYFAQGAWLSKHPLPPGFTTLWTTVLPNLNTFDGGDADPLSAISGPMWEVVTAFEARMPIGVGTLPSGTAIAVGGTGGSETVTLDNTNMPDHQHFSFKNDSVGGAAPNVSASTYPAREFDDSTSNVNRYLIKGSSSVADVGLTSPALGDASGNAVAHSNMSPYLGVYMLRRTVRTHYAVT